ncbi:MAG TPA: hypothetical protein VH743_17350 [Beijerinckiaceae bacterium]|jgi:hypothetical protein
MTRWTCKIGAVAALAGATSCAGDGVAQQRVTTRIPAGGERSVAAFGSISRSTCQAETPAIRIIQAPSQGSVRTGIRRDTIKTTGHPCFGRVAEQRAIYYTPKTDAVTSDSFIVHRSGTPASPRDETYAFQVSIFKPAPGVATTPVSGGVPLSPPPLVFQAPPSRPASRQFPRGYQEPQVPVLRSIRTR